MDPSVILNSVYQKILLRPVDMTTFIDLKSKMHNNVITIPQIMRTLRESDEYELIASIRNKQNEELKVSIKRKVEAWDLLTKNSEDKGPFFHIVLSRFSEDVNWIKNFRSFNCIVYVYNKGKEIKENFPENVRVINIPNIAYEDYAYLEYIVSNWNNFPEHVVFMQCNMDHNLSIYEDLSHMNSMNGYVNLNSRMGFNAAHDDDENPNYSLQKINDVTMEGFEIQIQIIRDYYCMNEEKLYQSFCRLFDIMPLTPIYFSFGANFHISRENILRNPLSRYQRILKCIQHFDKSHYKIITKCHSSILERLWFTIFNQ